jgi:excisionase family DNA binding protein
MKWLTPEQAAAVLQIPTSTVTYLCRKKRMPGAMNFSRKWLIPATTLSGKPPDIGVEQTALRAAELKAEGHPSFSQPQKRHVVYFVRAGCNGPVKIGTTANLKKRLELLQAGNHHNLKCLLTIDGAVAEERAMHCRFDSSHIRGEWFRYDGELRAFIRAARKTWRSDG